MCKGGNVIMKFEVTSSPHIRNKKNTVCNSRQLWVKTRQMLLYCLCAWHCALKHKAVFGDIIHIIIKKVGIQTWLWEKDAN